MPDAMTPEEKLLKHIRKPKTSSLSLDGGAASIVSASVATKEGQVIPVINRLLIVLCIAFLAFGFYSFFLEEEDFSVSDHPVLLSESVKEPGEIVLPKLKPYSVYADRIGRRDIFESPFDVQKRDDASQKGIFKGADTVGNLKLVGIIIDQDKEAVIVDQDAKKTLFLREGQTVNNAVVEKISENKVILIFENQRFELTP